MRHFHLYLILFFLTGCGLSGGNSSNDKPITLYKQRIANSKYVIYDFYYEGAFVSSNEYKGLTILDSNLTFSKNKIDMLPGDYFEGKPAINNLKMIDITVKGQITEKGTLLTPLKKYSKEFSGLKVNVTEYQETIGRASFNTGLMEYNFKNLKETNDSLILYGIKKKFGGKTFSSTTSFVKGNVKVIESANNNIDHIEIQQAVITRGEVYKTGTTQLLANRPIVGFATYWFYPKSIISSNALTDWGIFKNVK